MIKEQGQPVQPEQQAEQETRESYIAKLRNFIVDRAEAYRAEKPPILVIGDDGRIDPNPLSEAERWGKRLLSEVPPPTEQVGMLSFALFAKNLPQNEFVVARSSQQDNLKPKGFASTLILDRRTGDLVCAFSEVGADDTEKYRDETGKKAAAVSKLNLQGGASFDHGIVENDKGEIVVSNVKNIPVFYLALTPHHLYEGLRHFVRGNEQSKEEINLYGFFVASIYAQIKLLKVEKGPLNEDLEKKLLSFEKIILSEINREELSHIKAEFEKQNKGTTKRK